MWGCAIASGVICMIHRLQRAQTFHRGSPGGKRPSLRALTPTTPDTGFLGIAGEPETLAVDSYWAKQCPPG